MIEYVSKAGGRHLYNEDMINLQKMVLAFTEFFKTASLPFIIGGCDIYTKNGVQYIREGYVWLGGKVRYFPETVLDINSFRYVIPKDSLSDPIIYATPGISGPIYKEYGIELVHNIPNDYDGDYMGVFDQGRQLVWQNNSIEKVLFGKYSVTKNVYPNTISKQVDFLDVTINDHVQIGVRSSRYFLLYSKLYTNLNSFIAELDLEDAITEVSFANKTINITDWRGGENIIGENLSNKQIKLPTVNTKNITASSVSTKTMSIDGVSIDIVLRPKAPLINWVHLSGTDNLMAKQVHKDVFITGRLPFADGSAIIKSTAAINSNLIKKQTSIKLPDSISLPPDNTVFNVRGGNHCHYNGSANLYFDSDGYLCIEMDSREAFVPRPSSVCWHYIVD